MTFKTRIMKNVFEPIEIQMDRLGRLANYGTITPVHVFEFQTIVFWQLNGLAKTYKKLSQDGADDYQELESKVQKIIVEFCNEDQVQKLLKPIADGSDDDVAKDILERLARALESLEDIECKPLKRQLQATWNYVKEMGAVQQIEDFKNLEKLGTFLIQNLEPLQNYAKNFSSRSLREKIALYCCQLCAAFGILHEVVQEQHQLHAPIYSAKKYACDRMCWCFRMIIEVLDASHPTAEEENIDKENHFVYKMDLVLDVISSMPKKSNDEQIEICNDVWYGIEDVFSHAMAIAQVCQPCTFKAITGTSQSIISEYDNLKTQLLNEKPDPTLNNLFMNTLNDALYRLERKVNVAVLTLVMEVFSDPFAALKKLVGACGNPLNAKKRSPNDLDKIVEDFDQTIDKAMQIGMFAIACCNDVNRVTKIRHCMASLESLESELVPAALAFYLHPDNKEMRACLKLFTTKWQLEINKLHNLVDLIIDPSAYCQVILDDLQDRTTLLSNRLDNREGITRAHVQIVVQRGLALAKQLDASINDIDAETGDDEAIRPTLMMIRELKTAIYEVNAASKTLLVENATDSQQLRVIKRCELLLNVVKRLQPALVKVINSTTSSIASYGRAGMGQGDSLCGIVDYHRSYSSFDFSSSTNRSRDNKVLTYIRTPYTVKNYKPPLSIQPANSAPRTPKDLSELLPYITRGREMRTDRSVMYKTPKTTKISDETCSTGKKLRMKNLTSVRQHLFSRDSFVEQKDIDMSSESLDLTEILDQLTSMSDAYETPAKDVGEPPETTGKSVTVLAHLFDPITPEKSDDCSSVGGGDAPSTIATPDRVDDIQRLDERIKLLQKLDLD